MEQAILERVNQKVAAEPSAEGLMDFLFEALQGLCPCDRLGLAFLEDGGRRVVARWSRAQYGPLLVKAGYSEDLQQSSLQAVLERCAPRIIDDLPRHLDEHPRSRSTALLVQEGVRSSMTCALVVEGRPLGLLFLSSRTAGSYTAHHARLWQTVAERVAQAVEKAWTIEQLQAANQAYGEMLSFVSHELKNPVASMITDARVLAEGYLGPLAPAQTDKLQKLIRKGDHVLELVQDYLDLARLEEGLKLEPRRMDLVAEVIVPALELVQPQFEAKGQLLARDFRGPLVVDADPALLRIALVNFLGNAAKYGREGGRVRVSATGAPGGFRVAVQNEGPGWPPEEQGHLFRKFSRLQTPELRAQKGSGVGLYTAWRIVRLHGGRVEARSEQGQWAEFSLEIPQPLEPGGTESR